MRGLGTSRVSPLKRIQGIRFQPLEVEDATTLACRPERSRRTSLPAANVRDADHSRVSS